ncbi:uncharacterized protein LOC142791033 [Rhipicephalus microplus]|uniref:uncharacterized protein LOC142791033 n=1 Tax=Rhipicephalus microplus TaxID=6941 RepID=UPI003F6A89B0
MYQNRTTAPYVYVFVLLIGLLESDGSISSGHTPDMKEFLNKREPIWLYMTTPTTRRYDCNVYIIDNIQGEDVEFRRFLGYRKIIRSEWMQFLRGHLRHSTTATFTMKPYDVMDVTYRGGAPLHKETLLYQDKENRCGVVAVDESGNGNTGTTYELRVKNSSIEAANATSCFNVYKKTVGTLTARVSYESACQDILIGMNNIVPAGDTDNGAVGFNGITYNEPTFLSPMTLMFIPFRLAAVSIPTWLY